MFEENGLGWGWGVTRSLLFHPPAMAGQAWPKKKFRATENKCCFLHLIK